MAVGGHADGRVGRYPTREHDNDERGRDIAVGKRRGARIGSERTAVDQSKVWRLGGTWDGRAGRYPAGGRDKRGNRRKGKAITVGRRREAWVESGCAIVDQSKVTACGGHVGWHPTEGKGAIGREAGERVKKSSANQKRGVSKPHRTVG